MTDITIKEIFADIPPMANQIIKLRKLNQTDADDMFEYASDEKVTSYLSWLPHKSLKFTKNYLKFVDKEYKEGAFFDWAVILRESGKMIGTCGFTSIYPEHSRAEIGYVINPAYQSLGYATQAAQLVMSYAFEQLGINRLEAKFIVGNDASERVMKKLGMHREGVLRNYAFIKGSFCDICVYSILADEYFKNKYSI